MHNIKTAVITASDSCAAGKRKDESGRYILKRVKELSWSAAGYRVVPDEKEIIAGLLRRYCDIEGADLVLTTGGTGLSARDVTPEATESVIEKQIPGLPELMRMENFKRAKHSVLSRAAAGVRGGTLIINLPGSLKAVMECLELILPVIPHAVEIISGRTDHD